MTSGKHSQGTTTPRAQQHAKRFTTDMNLGISAGDEEEENAIELRALRVSAASSSQQPPSEKAVSVKPVKPRIQIFHTEILP